MKNNLFITAIIACFFFVTACKKEHQTIVNSKVINVDLKQNESYSYSIPPSGDDDDAMEISQQAQHAITSKITTDGARNTLIQYTPALNFTGSDEIHINTIEGEHKDGNNGEHHDGNCKSHENETETNYIFKINIASISTSKTH
jgi:hypothetical protein